MLQRLDLERVSAEAQQIDIGRGILTLVIGLFWLLGWTAAKIVIGISMALSFSIAAVRIGWQDAHEPVRRPRRGVGSA